jgi:K+-sensing histidine kinase KdpD
MAELFIYKVSKSKQYIYSIFIPPRLTFHVGSTDDSILFVMYFIIAMVNAVLTYKIRRVEKRARDKEERILTVLSLVLQNQELDIDLFAKTNKIEKQKGEILFKASNVCAI